MTRNLCIALSTAAALTLIATAAADDEKDAKTDAPANVYGFEVATINGEKIKLDKFSGDVLLIVNVASQCGLTDAHYKALEPLYQKHKDQGFRVLAFPANNFGSQEPGTNAEIKTFCTDKYNVTFDLFSKVSVKGDDICDLYKYLTEQTASDVRGEVKWNFQKYLVNRKGEVTNMWSPRVNADDESVTEAIEAALKQPKP
jgi:glutathione peroxidase